MICCGCGRILEKWEEKAYKDLCENCYSVKQEDEDE